VAALAVAATTPLGAAAHTGDPSIVTRIDAVAPALPGVTIEVRAGVADQLLVVNTTATPLTITATGGEPFLRISKDTAEANVASPDWYTSNSPLGTARVPATARPTATPMWRTVARTGAWGWFDHRLHPATRPLTEALRTARRVVRLGGWTVPFRYGGTPGTVTGHVEYRPLLGAFRSRVEHVPPGVALDVLDGRVPGLFLRWQGSGTLTVTGIGGEPFAMLDTNGVRVNDASPTALDDRRLRGDPPATVPTGPTWRGAGTQPRLTWLDRRLAYSPGFPPADVAESNHPTTLVEWDVPVDVDGRADHLRGTTTWVPNAPDTGHLNAAILWGALAAGVVAALVLVRLRTR
jgi:hypothetical protein